jgi:flagellar biosynthesis/type III secretory pathway protein FliH
MGEPFVPLDAFLRPAIAPEAVAQAPIPADEIPCQPAGFSDAVAGVRRFRAAVADAVDAAAEAILRDIAATVLARELELAPANLQAIVSGACLRFANDGAAYVRVHPNETALLAGLEIDVVADEGLRRGDALLEVKAGTIDLTLGARLAAVLDALAR